MQNQVNLKSNFIVVEGLEGAGKSTAIQYISEFLTKKNIKYITTREPGGTVLAEKIRGLIKENFTNETVYPETEVLLLYAARVQLLNNVIKPALQNNIWVVGDRHDLSTIAYQCGGRGVDFGLINNIRNSVMGEFTHDFCIYLDIDPKLGLQRAKVRGELDRIEQEDLEFFNQIRLKYLELAKNYKNIATIVIDEYKTREMIRSEIFNLLQAKYG